jgi:threonine dehydratase
MRRLVRLQEVKLAAARLVLVIRQTPLITWSNELDGRFYLKAENLQRFGSFKIRGAYNAIAAALAGSAYAGVVAHSSGNHGLAIAGSARMLGLPALIVVPANAPVLKRRAIQAAGAEVVVVRADSDARRETAARIASDRGWLFVSSHDDPAVIAGQGTIGIEVVKQVRETLGRHEVGDLTVLVPIGGGGLAAGVAVAIKGMLPSARVIGVEPKLAADGVASIHAGELKRWSSAAVSRTMADGLRLRSLGPYAFAHLVRYLDDAVTVSEREIKAAMRQLAVDAKLVAEPSGAVSVAGAVAAGNGGIVVAIVSGGNVAPAVLSRVLNPLRSPSRARPPH